MSLHSLPGQPAGPRARSAARRALQACSPWAAAVSPSRAARRKNQRPGPRSVPSLGGVSPLSVVVSGCGGVWGTQKGFDQ